MSLLPNSHPDGQSNTHLHEAEQSTATSKGPFPRSGAARPSSNRSLANTGTLSQENTLSQQDSVKAGVAGESSPIHRSSSSHGDRSLDHGIIDPPTSTPESFFSKGAIIGVLVSLGLHAAVMVVPTGHEPEAPAKAEEKQVRITQLPTRTKAAPAKPDRPPQRAIRPSSSSPIIRRTTTPISQPQPASKSQATSSDASTAASLSSGSQAGSDSAPAGANAWDDFPLYPNSQPGCFNLASCLQTGDALGQLSSFYAQELPAKKYQIKPTIKEASRQVYQVSRNGQAQFLSLIKSEQGSVYVLSDKPRSLADLKKAVEVPPEVSAVLSNLDAQNANPSYFAQPDLFYSKSAVKGVDGGVQTPQAGIRNISLVSGYAANTMMDEFFRSNLVNSDYGVTDLPKQYGGGKLYQVKKGSLTMYLNLVPTKDSSSTLVVTWKDPPK